jgi:hypothetical protein
MAVHELHCTQSPVVKENDLLRRVNTDLRAAFQRRQEKTVIEQHMNPRRTVKVPSDILDELGTLARGTVDDDDVIVRVRHRSPELCAMCGEPATEGMCMPYRVIGTSCTHIQLLCPACQPGVKTLYTAGSFVHEIERLSELGVFETAFMWEDSGRVRMLWGDTPCVETIR